MRYVPALIAIFLSTSAARADFQVDSPRFDAGAVVIDSNNNATLDHRRELNHAGGNLLDIGYGVTDWWQPTLQGEYDKTPGADNKYTATTIQNLFAFSRPGEYWLDSGAELNYVFSTGFHSADTAEIKLLLEKTTAQFIHSANLIVDKDIGANRAAGADVGLAWKTEYLYTPSLNPGIEFYGNINGTHNIDDRRRIGPVFYGDVGYGLSYELGWLFGIAGQSPDNTLKLNISMEFSL